MTINLMIATLLGIPLTSWRLSRDERWPGYWHRFAPIGITALLIAFALFRLAVAITNRGDNPGSTIVTV
ncbi:MAG: hypothetical protein V5A46_03965 [Haloferacaceae archaeon]